MCQASVKRWNGSKTLKWNWVTLRPIAVRRYKNTYKSMIWYFVFIYRGISKTVNLLFLGYFQYFSPKAHTHTGELRRKCQDSWGKCNFLELLFGVLFTALSTVSCQPEFRLISNQRRGMGEIARQWLDMSRKSGWRLAADSAVKTSRYESV